MFHIQITFRNWSEKEISLFLIWNSSVFLGPAICTILTAGSPLGQRLVHSHENVNEDKGCQLQDREGINDYNFTQPMRTYEVWTICIHDILKFVSLYAIF